MRFQVRMTGLAKRDIERNAQWWAQEHSVAQAELWFNTVHEQLRQLDLFPESNAVSVESDEFGIELRDKLVGLGSRRSYRAVFTIKGDTVHVLRVRRSAEQRLHPLDIPEEWIDRVQVVLSNRAVTSGACELQTYCRDASAKTWNSC